MQNLEQLETQLKKHVRKLSHEIGERNFRYFSELQKSEVYIEEEFRKSGYTARRQSYQCNTQTFANIEAISLGKKVEDASIVVGAHYDSIVGSPGANDNASGVAALLTLAEYFATRPLPVSLRFVAFVNEEPPFFQTEDMGSLRYARALTEANESVIGMLSLETIGYFSEESGSQKYPPGLLTPYPDTGNFISLVANQSSQEWLNDIAVPFSASGHMPCESGVFPEDMMGLGWSDHWAFWKNSYPALMVTDTAPFRYPHYHSKNDTFDKIDYPGLARVTLGLIEALESVGEKK